MKKQQNIELLAKGKKAAEGLANEGEVIDLNKITNFDEFGNINFDEHIEQLEEMKIDEDSNQKKKTKRKKEKGMELDLDFTMKNKKKDLNYRQRRNKKKKSSYIVKF